LVGVSEYRFTLFIMKYSGKKFEKFVELISWNSTQSIQTIEKIQLYQNPSQKQLNGVLVIFQIEGGNQLFVYDAGTKNFELRQNFKSGRTYQSLLRKSGYKSVSLDHVILSSALLANFTLIKTNLNSKNQTLKEHEGLLGKLLSPGYSINASEQYTCVEKLPSIDPEEAIHALQVKFSRLPDSQKG
jgi:hypothetical protein